MLAAQLRMKAFSSLYAGDSMNCFKSSGECMAFPGSIDGENK